LRDLLGGQIDAITLPVGVGFPYNRLDYQLSSTVVSTIDKRAEAEEDLKALLSGAADPYATLRSVYQQSREAAIADARGKPLELELMDDPLVDPADLASDEVAPDGAAGDPAVEPMPDPVEGTADPVETAPTDPSVPEPAPMLMGTAADH
jgi:phospholipid-binding lipoprotein MlaA